MLKTVSKQLAISYFFLFFLGCLLVLKRGLVYYPDSYAHLDMLLNRSPIYSIFLKGFTSVFGELYKIPLLFTQYLIFVLAVHFLLKTLHKILQLSFVSILVLQVVFLFNVLYIYLSVNLVLSEALTMPFLLFAIAYLFQAIADHSFKPFYKGLIILVLLILTRSQFIVLLPIAIIIVIYLFYRTKAYTRVSVLIVLMCLVPLLNNVFEKVYNKIVHDQYKSYAMTYVHLISNPFYISETEDVTLFKTEEEKDFFIRTHNQLISKKITLNDARETKVDKYIFFEKNFTKICNASVHEYNMDFYAKKGFDEYQQQYKVDEMTNKMFFPLLKSNFKTWLLVVYKSFLKGMGGIQSLFLSIIVFLYSLAFMFKKKHFMFLVLIMVVKFANGLIIAMVVHSIHRYTFYLDWALIASFVVLTDLIIKKNFNVT